MTETTIARITKSFHLDRRFRQARHADPRCPQCHGPVHPKVYGTPLKTNQDAMGFKEFGAALATLVLCGVAIYVWGAIAAASQVAR